MSSDFNIRETLDEYDKQFGESIMVNLARAELSRYQAIEAELIKIKEWVVSNKAIHAKMANESRFETIREAALADANNFYLMEKRIAAALKEAVPAAKE